MTCIATTQKGLPCRSRALRNEQYCRTHMDIQVKMALEVIFEAHRETLGY